MSSSSTRAKFITRFVAPSILLSTLAHAEGIDVVFKIDESGSMGDDITAVKANVSTIFNNLPTGSHVGLVGFGATGTHGYKPHLHRSLTTDSILFQNALDELVASGGIEPGYDAVFLSATDSLPSGSLGFTGAPYCNILISDEPSNGDDYSQTDAITAMQAHGGIFFGIVSSGTPTDSYDDIALATGGQMFDLAAFENDPTQALTAVLSACKAAVNVGYMTGGGSIIDEAGNRVRHGFELHCNINDLPNNLQVNWEHNQFHLETLTKVRCSDDPQLDEGKPVAGFDTYEGEGIGRLNGAEAEIKFTFTDAGEPGAKSGDKVTILIEADGHSVLSVTDKINQGNQQAHAGKE